LTELYPQLKIIIS